jgi:hypothetical protein
LVGQIWDFDISDGLFGGVGANGGFPEDSFRGGAIDQVGFADDLAGRISAAQKASGQKGQKEQEAKRAIGYVFHKFHC